MSGRALHHRRAGSHRYPTGARGSHGAAASNIKGMAMAAIQADREPAAVRGCTIYVLM
jgi:hypothetical protein